MCEGESGEKMEENERRDAVGYRGERQGEGKDGGGCCERCLNKAVPLYRSPAL